MCLGIQAVLPDGNDKCDVYVSTCTHLDINDMDTNSIFTLNNTLTTFQDKN